MLHPFMFAHNKLMILPTIMVPVPLCQLVQKSHFTVFGFTFLFVTFTNWYRALVLDRG